MSLRMKGNNDANRVFGWVLEMWGYNLAVRNMGIRHTVLQDLQVEQTVEAAVFVVAPPVASSSSGAIFGLGLLSTLQRIH